MTPSRIASLFLLLTCTALARGATHQIVVSAGDHDRNQTIVSFPVPADVADGAWQLTDGNSATPMQVQNGQAWFVLRNLQKGQSRTYRVEAAPKSEATVDVSREGSVVHVRVGGKELFDYQGAKVPPPAGVQPVYERGGYIHPILTPTGVEVDDDYPLNHKHHHGIWSVWTKTEFEGRHPDFWNMGDKTGTSEPRGFKDLFSGPVCGGFHAEHQMIDLSAKPPKPAINEQWDVIAFRQGEGDKPYYVFDIIVHHQCASESPLKLPEYLYGGMGFRGASDWNGEGKYTFLTDEGKDVKTGNGTRCRWCFTGGLVKGKPAGITIFCGTDSFRYPQPVRLNPKEPFFCYAPPAMGEFSITPSQPYYARYRFMVADGMADKGLIERIATDYESPPTVKVN